MTDPRPASTPLPHSPDAAAVTWADPLRQRAFSDWLARVSAEQSLVPGSVSIASADASFRRYLRILTTNGVPRIIMDAPPDKEDCKPFVKVAGLMQGAGVLAPEILAWDEAQGFMLLSDLGAQTMMQGLDTSRPEANLPRYLQALDALIAWQLASRPSELPPYDEALLRRELALFPDWYIAQHRRVALREAQSLVLQSSFEMIVQRNLAAPRVYVHRDFMPRNLMLSESGRLGVLDFQDAVYGPVTYDIASLMRDAFVSWEEEFTIDVTVRYWEQARRKGLLDFEDWHSDFGAFYRAVEWMGLQRHLKVAGIFGRLTLRDGKAKYLADAPRFIAYIRATASRYRELTPLLRLVDELEGVSAENAYSFGRL